LLDFLLEVSEATGESLDLDETLERVGEMIRRVVPAELLAIMLYSERGRCMRIRYAIGHRESIVRNLEIPLGEGLTGIAAETRQSILVNDVKNDPRYIPVLDAVRSEMVIPMIARDMLVGVIDLQSTRANAYTPYDRSLLQLLASRVALAVENARLYRRLERQNQQMRTLGAFSQEFASILDLDELLRKVAENARQLVNYDAFNLLLADTERRVLRHRFSLRYDQRVQIDNIPFGSGITGAALEAREPVRVNDTLKDARYIASHPGILSELAVPLILQDRVIGVLDLESEKFGFFTEEHVRIFSVLAPQIASAIENARLYEELAMREKRMEQDLRAARKLQKVLLPRKAPEMMGLESALGARPAREITGDIYDFFDRGRDRWLICFGDSSGKSAAAALYGALVGGLIRGVAQSEHNPSDVMAQLNDAVLERKVESKYVTLLLLVWNPHDRTFTMTNAGNTQPMIRRGDRIIVPKVEGVPVGLLQGRVYDEVVFQAQPGDVMLLYSDGVQDQHAAHEGDEEASEYGTMRLEKLLMEKGDAPPAEIVGAVFRDLDEWAAGAPITDDQTLIVMKVK
jgi:sigma-B regulation protein RsbU (phosphoserine phosphatase)